MRPTNDLNVIDARPLRSPDALKADLPITPKRRRARLSHPRRDPRGAPRARLPAARRRRPLLGARSRGGAGVRGAPAPLAPQARGRAPRRDARLLREAADDHRLEGPHQRPVSQRQPRHRRRAADRTRAPAAPRRPRHPVGDRGARPDRPAVPRRSGLAGQPSARARPRARPTARWRAGFRCRSATRTGRTAASRGAINAIAAASRPHSFLGIDGAGRVAIVRTAGNPDGHVVLRGGNAGPNYTPEHVAAAAAALMKAGAQPRVVVDCSHDNSGKSHLKQPLVVEEVAAPVASGSRHLLGVMIESNLVEDGRSSSRGCREPSWCTARASRTRASTGPRPSGPSSSSPRPIAPVAGHRP